MNSTLKQLIDEQRKTTFVPEAQADITDADACGILLAHHFEWDGAQILEAAVSALEDANFHRESEKVQELLDALMGGEDK